MSSTVANDGSGLTAVGYVDNSIMFYNTFRGVQLDNVNQSQTIIASTYYGDANLDGSVDGLDYALWAGTVGSGTPNVSTFTGGPVEWLDGDFNGDGVVDGLDYALWAGTVGSLAPPLYPLPTSVGDGASTPGIALGVVPEPGTLSLLGALLLCGFASRMFRKVRP